MPHTAFLFALLNLKIGNRGMKFRVPVHKTLVFVNQAVFIELNKDLGNGFREALIHSKAFAWPIRRCAQTAELVHNCAAGFLFPFPNALEEFFSAQIMTRASFFIEHTLNHHLRRNARMICARLPKGITSFHTVIADEDVLNCMVERMTNMEAAGDVGRRHHHGKGLRVRIRITGKHARLLGALVMFFFYRFRIKCFIKHHQSSLNEGIIRFLRGKARV